MRVFILWCSLLGLTACSLTPSLERPATPVPAHFPTLDSQPLAADAADFMTLLSWRTLFVDPRLQQLISQALDNNRDLRLAALNVQAAQAMSRIQSAAQWPSVGVEASGTRERSRTIGNEQSGVTEQVGVNALSSAFELDLFGRVRALSDAALARYLASAYGRDALRIALVGGVAEAYFAQQVAEEQRQLAERTLADWQQSLALARSLQQGKQSSGLDSVQAEGQVAAAEADLQGRRRALAQAGNALQLLVGSELPGALPAALPLANQPLLTPVPAGLPSAVLLARPDVQQAEQLLVAANADIGAARAAFFPQISLTASFGYASTSLGALFDPASQVWRFAPQLSQPLFQGGRLRAELRLAEVRKSEAVAGYERAIQTAFRDVADALAGTATFAPQIEAQTRFVSSAQRRVTLSGLRYQAGLDGRLELLDAQRQLYVAQQTLLELRRAEAVNTVALYKALGGGLHDPTTLAGAAISP